MRIEFDPAKDAENVRKHGISLARAGDLAGVARIEDTRFDYKEVRHRTYGFIDGLAYCLVFTIRDSNVRAISLRRALTKEMKRYAPKTE